MSWFFSVSSIIFIILKEQSSAGFTFPGNFRNSLVLDNFAFKNREKQKIFFQLIFKSISVLVEWSSYVSGRDSGTHGSNGF